MTLERWTPERRMERTRAALIESARHVFAERGFEGASLDEIAEAAGYTRGAIYKHFSNKEDLFFAVVDIFNTGVLDSFADQFDVSAGATLDAKQIAAIWIEANAASQEIWALGLEFRLYEYRNPTVRKRAAEWRRRSHATFAAFVEHHLTASGVTLKVPTETIVAMLSTASDGFTQAAGLDPDVEGLFAEFLDLFLPALIENPPDQIEPS